MEKDEYFLKSVSKCVGKAIYNYGLFEHGEKVMIALSGGKDSLSLVDILADWNKRSPVKIQMTVAHIAIDGLGYEADCGDLERFCAERGLPFIVRRTSVDFEREPGSDKCFVCAWFRRKALFDAVKECGCTKLAFGHHLDDIVETLLMNMSFRGSFSTMPVKLAMFGGGLQIVRPLCYCEEKDITRYSLLKKFPVQHYFCPFGLEQSRPKIRKSIEEISSLDPRVKRNIFNSMSNIKKDYIS